MFQKQRLPQLARNIRSRSDGGNCMFLEIKKSWGSHRQRRICTAQRIHRIYRPVLYIYTLIIDFNCTFNVAELPSDKHNIKIFYKILLYIIMVTLLSSANSRTNIFEVFSHDPILNRNRIHNGHFQGRMGILTCFVPLRSLNSCDKSKAQVRLC